MVNKDIEEEKEEGTTDDVDVDVDTDMAISNKKVSQRVVSIHRKYTQIKPNTIKTETIARTMRMTFPTDIAATTIQLCTCISSNQKQSMLRIKDVKSRSQDTNAIERGAI